jgi:hypothetical protein
MTTLTDVPPWTVGHPDLAPDASTDAGRLRSVALGRAVVADLLGGWLVQRPSLVATGTAAGSGLADLAVVDDPSPTNLADVAALRPDADHPVVWSLRAIPSTDGWEARPAATLFTLPAEARAGAGCGAADPVGVARVADHMDLQRLRSTLSRLDMNEPVGLEFLADARVRTWVAGTGPTAGLLVGVVVHHLDVVAAAVGAQRTVAALLDVWRYDRSDLDGVAVLPSAPRSVLHDAARRHTTPVQVAARTASRPLDPHVT